MFKFIKNNENLFIFIILISIIILIILLAINKTKNTYIDSFTPSSSNVSSCEDNKIDSFSGQQNYEIDGIDEAKKTNDDFIKMYYENFNIDNLQKYMTENCFSQFKKDGDPEIYEPIHDSICKNTSDKISFSSKIDSQKIYTTTNEDNSFDFLTELVVEYNISNEYGSSSSKNPILFKVKTVYMNGRYLVDKFQAAEISDKFSIDKSFFDF